MDTTMRTSLVIAIFILFCTDDSASVCSDQGVFPNPEDNLCQTYVYCFRLPDGVLLEKLYSCPNGTHFDPNIQLCSKNYQCVPPEPSTSTAPTPIGSECQAEGRYPEANDATCTLYFFCHLLPSGKYVMVNYKCPTGTKFDPKFQTCSTSYQCSSSTTLAPTTPSTSSIKLVCNEQGRFPVMEDVSCQLYYYCLYIPGGGYTQQTFRCPSTLKFDPKNQTCSGNYQCASSTTLTPTTPSTTPAPTTSSTTLAPTTLSTKFTCNQQGRFPMKEDVSCRSYYYCLYTPGAGFSQQTFRCPSTLKFDPKTQTCSENYQCSSSTTPATPSTTLAPTTLSTTPPPTTLSTTPPSTTLSTTPPTTTLSTTTPSTTLAPITPSTKFACNQQGRFPMKEDKSCQSYYYCLYNPGAGFTQQTFRCPSTMKFDPKTQTCKEDYVCSS